MTTIDNFNRFQWIFKEGEFYFIQIIKRKKDNPDVLGINGSNHMRCLREYSIYTQEHLDKYKQEMIDISEITNSRVYIHPARRSKEKIKMEMLKCITENITSNKHNLSGLYRTACGKNTNSEKLWIVDLDKKDRFYIDDVISCINKLNPVGPKIKNILPTVNGIHLIISPFNLQEFRKFFDDDVHKNNPTLLYFKYK